MLKIKNTISGVFLNHDFSFSQIANYGDYILAARFMVKKTSICIELIKSPDKYFFYFFVSFSNETYYIVDNNLAKVIIMQIMTNDLYCNNKNSYEKMLIEFHHNADCFDLIHTKEDFYTPKTKLPNTYLFAEQDSFSVIDDDKSQKPSSEFKIYDYCLEKPCEPGLVTIVFYTGLGAFGRSEYDMGAIIFTNEKFI